MASVAQVFNSRLEDKLITTRTKGEQLPSKRGMWDDGSNPSFSPSSSLADLLARSQLPCGAG